MSDSLVTWKQFEHPRQIYHVDRFDAAESISGLFTIHVRLFCEKEILHDRDLAQLTKGENMIGAAASIGVILPSEGHRYFNGVITRFSRGETDDKFAYFDVTLAPWFWLLTQRSDSRVFQNKTAIEIVTQVFDERAADFPFLVRFRDDTTEQHVRRDCTVQYQESDFAFVSRLLEDEGVCYYFDHVEDEHTLVLCDEAKMLRNCPGVGPLKLLQAENQRHLGEDYLTAWNEQHTLVPGKHTMRDYHFQMPNKNLEVDRVTKYAVADNDKLEVYEYPGEYATPFNDPRRRLDDLPPEAQLTAERRIQEHEMSHRLIHGSSACRALTAGYLFHRTDAEQSDFDGTYLLTAVQHSVEVYRGNHAGETGTLNYHNHFTCLPVEVAYRPLRETPKPGIHGVQTARVVGPESPTENDSAEIHVDEFGRVRVKFHWDRSEHADDRNSAWIRVGQGWASGGFGMHFWPRVGDEVIVAFENGDPDRPILVGSVYNSQNMPPYALPEHKTRSGIKTKSSTQGDVLKHYNELRFEDQKGKEQVYIHAERNFDKVVEQNETTHVGYNRTDQILHDERRNIANKRFQWIGEKHKAPQFELEDADALHVIGSRLMRVTDGVKWRVEGGDADLQVEKGDYWLFCNEGNANVVALSGDVNIEAMQSIQLKVGNNVLRIDQKGITLIGNMITNNAMTTATTTSQVTNVMGLTSTNISSTGPLALKGASSAIVY